MTCNFFVQFLLCGGHTVDRVTREEKTSNFQNTMEKEEMELIKLFDSHKTSKTSQKKMKEHAVRLNEVHTSPGTK
jgi:hypothetical protein